MIVNNLNLVAKLKALEAASRRNDRVSVVVGYTGANALALHEMTPVNRGKPRRSGKGVYWGPSLYGGQFLLGPARQFAPDVAGIVRRALKRSTGDLLLALHAGGLKVQRESVKRAPREYGDLVRSAFTEKE